MQLHRITQGKEASKEYQPGLSDQDRGKDLKAFLLLAVVSFTGIFLFCSFFGAYEDDYSETLSYFGFQRPELLSTLQSYLLAPPQGRPVGWALNALLASVLGHQHNLEYSYLVGWLILTFNACLLFLLLKKCLSRNAAIVGALFLLLLPFDLAKAILMHRVFVYGSMTFLLLGLNLLSSDSKWLRRLSYPVAYLTLLTWEGCYLPFLFAPLLFFEKSKRWLIRAIVHVGIWGAMLGITLLIRYLTGENRIVALAGGGQEMIMQMLSAMLIGPLAVVRATVTRPFETVLHAEPSSLLIGGLTAGAILYYLIVSKGESAVPRDRLLSPRIVAVLGAGIAAVLSPYVLMYRPGYFPPNVTIGRLSAEHVPAEFGYCVVVACIYFFAEDLLKRFGLTVKAVFALFFGCLMAFSLHIQKADYVEGWLDQRLIWTQIAALIPDVNDGIHVIVDLDGVPGSQMFSQLWLCGAADHALRLLFKFPQEWKTQPDLIGFASWSEHEKTTDSVTLKEPSWAPASWPVLRSGNFILLREKDGELQRIDEPVDLFGVKLTPITRHPAPALSLTSLGQRLLRAKSSQDWPGLRDELPYPISK
jgi:hypothetical protein